MTAASPATDRGVPRSGKRLVLVALVLLLVPGIVGFDAWPLTAWRLFSLARRDHQTMWVLHTSSATDPDRELSLEELPLRFRHAAWPMAELPSASAAHREAVCQALLEPAEHVVPGLSELRIVRDRQQLVEADGEWVVRHDPETIHACHPERST